MQPPTAGHLQAFAHARATFPNFPEDIFLLWLDDRIRYNGWPPIGPEWDGFLHGRDILSWQQVRWQMEAVSLSQDLLTSSAFSLVTQIIDAAINKKMNAISAYIPDSEERFRSSLCYVQKHGPPPGTVLLLKGADGYDIVDGNHRIAAALANMSQRNPPVSFITVDAWVAR